MHPNTNEMQFVLEGTGTVVLGGEQLAVEPDATVIIPPNIAHFTLPDGLVLAAINTPPFEAEDYIVLTDSDPEVHYDKAVFEAMTQES